MEELTGRAAVYARRAKVVEMRHAGKSWAQIARAVGLSGRDVAASEYRRAIALNIPAALATAEQLRNLAEVLATTGSNAA